MEEKQVIIGEVYAPTRKDWRRWLEANHLKISQIWLVLHKISSPMPSVNYEESVEEALCFGWIDSKPQKRDENCYLLFFSRRKPRSVWSAINKKRIIKLTEAGLMKPAGIAAVETAKANGSWTSIDNVEAMIMPEELKYVLNSNPTATHYFDAFPASAKKGIYQWIASAKTESTRMKRVIETVELAEKNIRANQWKKK
jgi:uncharacterized protein YdeI (YjbR/CyaY-like superfamily)